MEYEPDTLETILFGNKYLTRLPLALIIKVTVFIMPSSLFNHVAFSHARVTADKNTLRLINLRVTLNTLQNIQISNNASRKNHEDASQMKSRVKGFSLEGRRHRRVGGGEGTVRHE